MKKRKSLSLNKTILKIMLAGYAALLCLLLCMDYYLIVQHHLDDQKKEQTVLENYLDSTAKSMDRIWRILYDISGRDDNFQALSGELSEVQQYSNAYDLCETLQGQMLIDEELQGFYLFYGTEKMPLYRVNIEQIYTEHASRIGAALKMMQFQEEPKPGKRFSVSIDSSVYAVVGYRKGNAAVYGIRNIGDVEKSISEELGKEVKVVLLADGRVAAHQELAARLKLLELQSEAREKFEYNTSTYTVYGARVPNMELWICPVLHRSLGDYVTLQQAILLLLTVFSFAAVAVLFWFTRKNLILPLRYLRYEMERIRKGDSRNIPEIDIRFSELQEVTQTLQNMITQLEAQRLLAYDALIEKQKAQMQYLQLQIQPHFYLNGLKTLNALALEQHTDKVQSLILGLSEHLRYLMQAERETTTLQRELNFVENYVALQNQMTGRNIQLQTEAEPEILQWCVPVLMVQTFVENSIKYTKLGSTSSVLLIEVKAARLVTDDGNYLDLQISDNGQGYPDDILEEVNGKPKTGEKHVGINNLKRRCELLYGLHAEFSFFNMDGAVSECILPEREEDNEGITGRRSPGNC